jgi:hypothetical protein
MSDITHPPRFVVSTPLNLLTPLIDVSIFLSGSSEIGSADWQKRLTLALNDLPVAAFNRQRDDFNENLVQDMLIPPFRAKAIWELERLEEADLIIFYFQPSMKCPVSLLDLGMFLNSGRVVVCCPEGYESRDNVQIVCERSKVPLVETLQELENIARQKLEKLIREKHGRLIPEERQTSFSYNVTLVD